MPPPVNNTLPRTQNAVERYFIETLTRNGLDEVDAAGIQKLSEYVERHDIDGFEVRDESNGLSEREKGYLAALLDKPEFRGFLTNPGRAELERKLGRYNTIYGGLPGKEVTMPTGSLTRVALGRVETSSLATAFRQEVAARSDIFQNPLISAEEKGKKLYLLFKDYCEALNGRFSSREQRAARNELLSTLADIPAASVFLLKDSDEDGFANAYELAHGLAPGRPENQFPKREHGWSTYQNMHGSFYEIATKLDALLKAQGRPGGIEAYERTSALAWIIGDRPGNTTTGAFDEARAISSTSDVDFVKCLFPASSRVAGQKLEAGFDIAVDFLDGAGGFVSFNRGAGDRMVALHAASGEVLRAKVEDVVVEGEEKPRYRPIFEKASGEVVPASEVKLVIQDFAGRTKGDGKVEGHHSAGWWGFCDRNALNTLVTTRYGYPAPDQDVTLQVGDKTFTFGPKEVLDIVGRRMTELFARYDYTGERFDDELSRLVLKDGTSLLGRLRGGPISTERPDALRNGDQVTISARGNEDAFGRQAIRLVKHTGAGEDEAKLIATDLKGETFEFPAADLQGGFRATNVRPVAWAPAATDVRALADLVVPVAEAKRVGSYRSVPSAEQVATKVNAMFEALAANPDVDLGSSLYQDRDYSLGSLVNRWAMEVGGADVRAEQFFLPALAELKRVYAAHTDPTERTLAMSDLTRTNRNARVLNDQLSSMAYELRTELGYATDEAWWRVGYDERAGKVLEWYDPSDAAKVTKMKERIASSRICNSVDILFRAIERDRVLTKVEAYRKKEEEAATAEATQYLNEFKGMVGRVDGVAISEEELQGNQLRAKGYQITVKAAEGSQSRYPTTFSVSEESLHFDRLSYYGSYTNDTVLEDLRKKVFDWAKGVAASGTVAKSEEEMVFTSPKTIPQRFDVALPDGTQRQVRSDEIRTLSREEASDMRFEEMVAHVMRHDGVTNADSWMNEGVSNGLHVFDSVHSYTADDRDAPTWVAALKDQELFGRNGAVKDKSRVRFFDLGQESHGSWSSGTRGWIEFGENNLPVNSATLQGDFDFLWTVEGAPDWKNARPTFNPNVPSDLVLQLYVRSVKDPAKLQELADKKLLPADWRSYLA